MTCAAVQRVKYARTAPGARAGYLAQAIMSRPATGRHAISVLDALHRRMWWASPGVQHAGLFVALFSASLLAVPTARAASIIVATAAQEDAAPRYELEKSTGGESVVGGICIDILRAIERVDPQIRFSGDQNRLPLRRVQLALQFGEIDAYCGLNKSAEREQWSVFIEPPLYALDYTMAVNANDEVQIRSFDDVRRLGANGTILVMSGSESAARLHSLGGLDIDSSGTGQEANLRKLLAGRGRFFYRHALGLRAEIHRLGLEDKIRILPVSLDKEFQYLLVSKKAPPEVVDRLRRAVVKLQSGGELARIMAKY